MTAKEIASYAKRNVELSGVDMDEVYTYSFMPKQFEDFVNQLCKEQRENCAEEIVSAGVSVIKKKVLEAKQPEV